MALYSVANLKPASLGAWIVSPDWGTEIQLIKHIIIDCKAGEIIRLVASICPSVCSSVDAPGAEWAILELGFAKYSKKYTPRKNH